MNDIQDHSEISDQSKTGAYTGEGRTAYRRRRQWLPEQAAARGHRPAIWRPTDWTIIQSFCIGFQQPGVSLMTAENIPNKSKICSVYHGAISVYVIIRLAVVQYTHKGEELGGGGRVRHAPAPCISVAREQAATPWRSHRGSLAPRTGPTLGAWRRVGARCANRRGPASAATLRRTRCKEPEEAVIFKERNFQNGSRAESRQSAAT
jgi:hypothetical protein